MARVQVFEGGQVAPAPATSARFQPQDFGPGVGAGLEQLGEAGQQAAGVLQQTAALHDEAAVKEATNGVNQWYAEAAYTGPNALFGKVGKDALTTAPMVTTGLQNEIANTRKGLQNDRQRYLFDEAVNPQNVEWQTQIGRHVLEQTRTYATNESIARAGMTGEMAGLTYLDDPAQGEKHIEVMNAEIANAGRLQGLGPDAIRQKQFVATSGIYKDVGTQIASAGPQGWDLARSFVETHKASMSDDDRAAVLTRADVEQHAFEAEQRQAAAEQRRQQSEDMRDARDRAESGLGRLDSGLPLSPDEYTQLHQDALATGDPNLIKRVEEGQFTNNLSIQHQHDTPTQLQDRINTLSASITKAGAKADPNQIIERDHLQQMFNQSSSQLNSDSLSWGAAHLGIPVQPLNIDDPNSIANRVAAASKIAAQTGHAPQVLTASEATAMTPQWTRGDTSAKINLVSKIARFGPLAVTAAQQIAPNDNGLIHLVSLAQHSNKGVGLSRVTQALAGYEAMKTEAQIVGKVGTLPDFNTFVGSSLQFMPGARDGVFTVAKALLAEDASQRGWKDNNDADPKAWYRAINSALGAYNRGDVQFGGLAGVNGAQTVLPENMSLDDFENRISRANGAQFKAAGNGEPVLGNGSPLSAGDLKKLHFVPVDDGVYRLEMGGSFVHTKAGQPFEVDVRKLNGATGKSFDAQLAAHGYARY